MGAISPWINLDAVDPLLRADSVAAFRQELAWSSHISMSAVILPTPSAFPYNYAHVVADALQSSSYAQLMVRIPMMSRKALLAESGSEREAVLSQMSHLGRPLHDSWEWWNTLREMCDHHHNLNLALEVTADLPSKEVCFILSTFFFYIKEHLLRLLNGIMFCMFLMFPRFLFWFKLSLFCFSFFD